MNITNKTNAHQMRIILTRTVHTIDTVAIFTNETLVKLMSISKKLEKVMMTEKECVTTLVMKEMISMDIEALQMNMGVIESAIKLGMYKFENNLCMN